MCIFVRYVQTFIEGCTTKNSTEKGHHCKAAELMQQDCSRQVSAPTHVPGWQELQVCLLLVCSSSFTCALPLLFKTVVSFEKFPALACGCDYEGEAPVPKAHLPSEAVKA